jgi:peptide/nickel transport system permease protein
MIVYISELRHSVSYFWARYKKNKLAVVGIAVVIILIGTSILADVVAPYKPLDMVGDPLEPPFGKFIFGTDELGRDLYSRIVCGIQTSLIVGLMAAIIATCIGILIGSIAGYFGGKIDEAFNLLIQLFLVIPAFILALIITAIFGRNIWNIVLAISVVMWTTTARLARAQFLSLKERDFVLASLAVGERKVKIIFSEILPNAMPPIIVNTMLTVAHAIIVESGISFLGMGDPLRPSLGRMLFDAMRIYHLGWWTAIFPGIALVFLIMSMNLMGDGLNEALNPRLRQ